MEYGHSSIYFFCLIDSPSEIRVVAVRVSAPFGDLAILSMMISFRITTLKLLSAVSLISVFSSTISHFTALKSKQLTSSFWPD